MRYTPDIITDLNDNEIFVFGSNESGLHEGGAARIARQWGAIYGKGSGIQGRTYAIPTMSIGIQRPLLIKEIKPYVDEFISFTEINKDRIFLVTKIGCGIAGHKIRDIASLFVDTFNKSNIILPVEFYEYIA